MTDNDETLPADAPLAAKDGARPAAFPALAREAFFGGVSVDRMIERFFDEETPR